MTPTFRAIITCGGPCVVGVGAVGTIEVLPRTEGTVRAFGTDVTSDIVNWSRRTRTTWNNREQGGHFSIKIPSPSSPEFTQNWFITKSRPSKTKPSTCLWDVRADSGFAPNQWEMALLCDDISHWLGASLETGLSQMIWGTFTLRISENIDHVMRTMQ